MIYITAIQRQHTTEDINDTPDVINGLINEANIHSVWSSCHVIGSFEYNVQKLLLQSILSLMLFIHFYLNYDNVAKLLEE